MRRLCAAVAPMGEGVTLLPVEPEGPVACCLTTEGGDLALVLSPDEARALAAELISAANRLMPRLSKTQTRSFRAQAS